MFVPVPTHFSSPLLPAPLRASATSLTAAFTLRWLVLAAVVGALAGTASAGFLVALDWVTSWREAHDIGRDVLDAWQQNWRSTRDFVDTVLEGKQ